MKHENAFLRNLARIGRAVFALFFAAMLLGFGAKPSVAEESEITFLLNGKPIEEHAQRISNRDYRRYQRAIELYGSEPCITDRETINWDIVTSIIDLKVCLFFAAAKLGDNTAIAAMLRKNGFSNVTVTQVKSSSYNGVEYSGQLVRINANMARSAVPRNLVGRFSLRLFHGLSVAIRTDPRNQPIKVSATFTRT